MSRFICAHRGASGTHCENTVDAMAEAVRLGVEQVRARPAHTTPPHPRAGGWTEAAEQVEFDVRMTKDRQMVILHDATVDRTTDGEGSIWDLTLAEVKQLRVVHTIPHPTEPASGATAEELQRAGEATAHRIPTLSELLDSLPAGLELNVHTCKCSRSFASSAFEASKKRLHQTPGRRTRSRSSRASSARSSGAACSRRPSSRATST